jgi:Cof subfamily protein (haloacid dehalogenase superfamily)
MKLIFLDIDGTLFSHKTFSVPASAVEACRKAKENGHLLFLSSGRSPVLTEVFRKMDFISGQVCQDGAYVEAEGKVIFDHPMKEGEAGYLMDLAEITRACVTIRGVSEYFSDEAGIADYHVRFDDNMKRGRDPKTFPAEPLLFREYYHGQAIYKADAFFHENTDRIQFVNGVKDRFNWMGMLSESENSGMGGEITSAGISKATGIRSAAEYYHVPMADTIAFGDSANDTEMLEAAGISVAMGNGAAVAKEAADFVTDDVDEDGIANAFKKLGLIC